MYYRSAVPNDAQRMRGRQVDREGGEATTPDGITIDKLKVVQLGDPDGAGDATLTTVTVMDPEKDEPYLYDGGVNMLLYLDADEKVSIDDEIWGIWQPGAQLYLKLSATGGVGASAVATVTEIIPAREDKTPGGAPGGITAIIQESLTGGDFTEGDEVQVYSWVRSDSPDPADQPDQILYIFISKDQNGVWWYHAVDCEEPDPAYVVVPGGGTVPSDGTGVTYVS